MAKASNGNAAQQCVDCCEQIKKCCEDQKAQGVQAVGGVNWLSLLLPILQAFLNALQQNQPVQAAPKKP